MTRKKHLMRCCFHVLCKIGIFDYEALDLEFKWRVLGLKWLIFNWAFIHIIASIFLKKKLVEALLPGNIKILYRNATTDYWVIEEIYRKKIYDRRYLPKTGDIVFDVGSHIGIFTLKASKLVGPSGAIYSFEPEPENFSLLKQNVKLNEALNCKVFNKAVSKQAGTLQLYIHPVNTGMSSVQIKRERTYHIPVSTITLDSILKKSILRKINFLKIDVEGHELEVIKGACQFINICENIVIETHEREGGPPNVEIIKALRKHNFKTELIKYDEFNDLLYGWK